MFLKELGSCLLEYWRINLHWFKWTRSSNLRKLYVLNRTSVWALYGALATSPTAFLCITDIGSRSFCFAAQYIIDPNLKWLSKRLLYMVFFGLFKGTTLLQVDKAYSAEFNLDLSFSIWPEKHNWSSISKPRNFTVFSGHVWPTQVISLLPMYKGLTWAWWSYFNSDTALEQILLSHYYWKVVSDLH